MPATKERVELNEAEQFLESKKLLGRLTIPRYQRWGDFPYNEDPKKWREKIDADVHEGVREVMVRHEFVKKFAFAVLTTVIAKQLAKYSPLLEVGCGSGFWAHELQRAGADIIATDPGKGRWTWEKVFFNYEKLDGVTAVQKYLDRTLLVVWPEYDTKWPGQTLAAFKGKRVIYVGEGAGGCTGDKRFHQILERDFVTEKRIALPQFEGLHDDLTVYRRKGFAKSAK